MKNFFETLSNIWRDRILLTLALLAVYRLGSFIPLPGVDEMKLIGLNEAASNNGPLGLLNSFTGGAFAHAAILGLGVMPYISASIVVQLMHLRFLRSRNCRRTEKAVVNNLRRLRVGLP